MTSSRHQDGADEARGEMAWRRFRMAGPDVLLSVAAHGCTVRPRKHGAIPRSPQEEVCNNTPHCTAVSVATGLPCNDAK